MYKVCTPPDVVTDATTRAVQKKKTLVHRHKTRALQCLLCKQLPPCVSRHAPPPPAHPRPFPSPGAKTPAKGRHASYSQQHVGATHARALLCLLVKLAGVAQVDRHWHPARRRGKLRRRLGFRLCLSPRTTRPRGQQARRNGDRHERKEVGNQHTPTKYSPRSLVAQSARDTTDDNQTTAARRADKASTTKARGCGKKKKAPH